MPPSEEATDAAASDSEGRRPVLDRWQPVLDLAPQWRPPNVPTVVVVPHPDDEVLIAGGLIRMQRERKTAVRILAVTDGEAAYDEPAADHDRRVLAACRRREQCAALEELGVGRAAVDRLALPDGSVADHVVTLSDWIATEYPEHLVVSPWNNDQHPDHEACGRAAEIAARRGDQTLLYGFFWTWHRCEPSVLDGARLRRLPLPKRIQRQRRRAISSHRSQLDRPGGIPVLTPTVLEPMWWTDEYYLEAAPSTRSRSDHDAGPVAS